MEERLPNILHVSMRDKFKILNKSMIKSLIIKDLTHFILNRKSENDYFDFDKYNQYECLEDIIKEIELELDDLGWNHKLSFGGSAIFIYTSENPPPSCW